MKLFFVLCMKKYKIESLENICPANEKLLWIYIRGEKYDNQIEQSGYRFHKLDMAMEKVSEMEGGLEENSQNKAWSDKNMDNIENKDIKGMAREPHIYLFI